MIAVSRHYAKIERMLQYDPRQKAKNRNFYGVANLKNSLTLTRIVAILFAFITCISICACEGETHNTSNGNNVSDNSSTISAKVAVNNDYVNPIYPIVNGKKTFTYQADPFVVRDDDGV